MSYEIGTATDFLDLLKKLDVFLRKGHSCNPSYTGTGSGYIDGIIGSSSTSYETITITFTSSTAFDVVGSVTGAMGSGTVGTLFTHAKASFTVVAGLTAWVTGDTISFLMTRPWSTVSSCCGCRESSVNSSLYPGANLFDNSATSYWNTQTGLAVGWVEFERPEAFTVAQYYIDSRVDSSVPTLAPRDFNLEYWNGSTWVVADARTGQTSWAQGERRAFTLATPISAARWRINVTANNGGATLSFANLGLRPTVDGTNVANLCSVWKAPGNDNISEIIISAYPYYSASGDYFNLFVGAMTSVSDDGFTKGGSQYSHFPLWNASIPYWIFADGKRLIITAKVSTVYETCYLGLMDSYISPGSFPLPLCVCSPMSYTNEPGNWSGDPLLRWSSTGVNHSHFWMSCAYFGTSTVYSQSCTAKMRKPGGSWRGFSVGWDDGSYAMGSVWPGSSGLGALYPNLDGSYPLFPIILSERDRDAEPDTYNTYGELSGIAHIPGYLNASENIVVQGHERWLVVQNAFRTGRSDYAAIRLS